MTLSEAQDFLLAKGIQRRETDMFPAAPYIDAFEANSDERFRDRLREAMWTVLSDGGDEEQAVAATFFAKTGLPPSLADAAAKLYLARDLDASSPLAAVLAGVSSYSTSSRSQLRDAFHKDPEKHASFAYSKLIDAHDAADFAALSTLASTTQDAATLANVFTSAFSAERAADLTPVLSSRPPELLRAAAGYTLESEFLAAAGLKP